MIIFSGIDSTSPSLRITLLELLSLFKSITILPFGSTFLRFSVSLIIEVRSRSPVGFCWLANIILSKNCVYKMLLLPY